jgi:hypothetical protein
MIRLWTMFALILAGILTVAAFFWMGKLVGATHSACQLYPYTSGCR